MAFWLFKSNPERYRLADRLTDPNPAITWTVKQHRELIQTGDVAFLWVTGQGRGIRAVMRVDEPPRDMHELESEQEYWTEREDSVHCRVVGTLVYRDVHLPADRLGEIPELAGLPVGPGPRGTKFPLSTAQGELLLRLVESSGGAAGGGENAGRSPPSWGCPPSPVFEVGRTYNRRADIHGLYGGQMQGGISTPRRVTCVFLFTGPSGEQHGYRDGWNDDGVFLYTGEGQAGDMEFVRGNLAIRDHAVVGRDLHLFEAQSEGMYRYAGVFDCVGWEYRRAPDTAGTDRQVIVFHLLPENEQTETTTTLAHSEPAVVLLDELRRRAYAAIRPPGERPSREARRNYYERSAAVRSYVLTRADGRCEACRRPSPFRRPDGTLYLEPHHTRRVADGGPDHPRWVAAVCPNCHAEVHHGERGAEVNRSLEVYLGTVETGEQPA